MTSEAAIRILFLGGCERRRGCATGKGKWTIVQAASHLHVPPEHIHPVEHIHREVGPMSRKHSPLLLQRRLPPHFLQYVEVFLVCFGSPLYVGYVRLEAPSAAPAVQAPTPLPVSAEKLQNTSCIVACLKR